MRTKLRHSTSTAPADLPEDLHASPRSNQNVIPSRSDKGVSKDAQDSLILNMNSSFGMASEEKEPRHSKRDRTHEKKEEISKDKTDQHDGMQTDDPGKALKKQRSRFSLKDVFHLKRADKGREIVNKNESNTSTSLTHVPGEDKSVELEVTIANDDSIEVFSEREPVIEMQNNQQLDIAGLHSYTNSALCVHAPRTSGIPTTRSKIKAETHKETTRPVKVKSGNHRHLKVTSDKNRETSKDTNHSADIRRGVRSSVEMKEIVDNPESSENDSPTEEEDEDTKLQDGGDTSPQDILSNNFMQTLDMEDTSSVQSGSDDKKAKRSKKDGRFYKFVKRHFLQRRKTGNDVKEICIIPDDEEFRWARRSAGSAASRSSEETLPNSTDSQVKVVHDMAEEYVPDV